MADGTIVTISVSIEQSVVMLPYLHLSAVTPFILQKAVKLTMDDDLTLSHPIVLHK